MPHYEDPPEDWICRVCNDEGCSGCPRDAYYDDEPNEIWLIKPDAEDKLLSREDYAIIEHDIRLQIEEEQHAADL